MKQRTYIDLQEGMLKVTIMDEDGLIAMARGIRLIAVRGRLDVGHITEEEALEILRGPLDSGDDTTIRDDSWLLHANWDVVKKALYGDAGSNL